MAKFLGPDDGPCYAWSNDNTRVLIDSNDSSGGFTLVEDRMKPEFGLGLHMHRTHSESFYILEGAVEFTLEERRVRADVGAAVHVPPGTPHAVRVLDGWPARMLMIYYTAGFDRYLERLVGLEIAAKAKTPRIGEVIDQAMIAIEQANPKLKGGSTEGLRPAVAWLERAAS